MTKIYLVRHGQTDWNLEKRLQGQTDIPLNDWGRSQAACVGTYFKDHGLSQIYTSCLSRAHETGSIIAGSLGNLPLDRLDQLGERAYGQGEGYSLEERESLFPSRTYPGSESMESVTKRMMTCLKDLACRHQGESILVVSHGGAINSVLAHLSQGQIGSGKTKLGSCSISRISGDESLKIDYYNRLVIGQKEDV